MPGIAIQFLRKLPWTGILQALLMLLLVQARLLETSPLAAAWLCAAAGEAALWRWLGMAAGAALAGGAGWWALPVAGAAVVAAGQYRLGREATSLLAGCLCVTEAMARTGADPVNAAAWLLTGLAAMALTLPLTAGWAAQPRKRAILRHAAFVGLAENAGALKFPGRSPAQPKQAPAKAPKRELRLAARERNAALAAGRMILGAGASSGAAAAFGGQAGVLIASLALLQWPARQVGIPAVLTAAALGMSGVPMDASGALLAAALMTGWLQRFSRPLQAVGGLTMAGAWLLAGGRADGLTYLLAMAPAGAVLCLLPGRPSPSQAAADEAANQRRLQKQTQRQLSAMADALSDMAQGPSSGLDPPCEQDLLLSLRTRLCEGCVRYERCWNGRAGEGLRLLCELITRSANGALPKAVLPDMLRRCLRANIIPTRLYPELERFAQVRQAQMARLDGARRARLSIDTAAQLLRDMAQAQDIMAANGLPAAEAALRCGGIHGVCVTPLADGWALSRRDGWTREDALRACRACGKGLGVPYKCSSIAGRTLCIREAPGLVARIGWAGLSAEGSRSGDSIYTGPLDDRRQLVLISDGMGVGKSAAGVSRRAVQIIRKFLCAGIPPERAALLANQLMISQGGAEIFATLDLCVIDNGKMEAIFVKMAACDSYLLREHDCSVISGGRLPMGILAEATPQVCVCRLLPGDVIVMGTDGAMEGLDVDAAQRCLIRRRQAEEKQLAQAMIRAGESGRTHADDRTLAVIRMEKSAWAQDGGDVRYG